MSVSQSAFDTDLDALLAAIAQLITAYDNAAPNLATEDGEVKTALANIEAVLPAAGSSPGAGAAAAAVAAAKS